jgi:glycosyltransferase involved in cell wall biosynthesis
MGINARKFHSIKKMGRVFHLKILITTGIYPPDIGGPATFVPKLVEESIKADNQVIVVTLAENAYQESGLKYEVIAIKRHQNIVVRSLKVILALSKQLGSVDAVFSNGLYPETASLLKIFKIRKSLAKIVGDPVWEKARNQNRTGMNLTDFITGKPSIKDRILRWIYLLSWNQFSALTCPSEELCGVIKGLGVRPSIFYIPNGVDIRPEEIQHKKYDLVCVSRLVSWKNLDVVIEAAILTGSSLAIVGDGPMRGELTRLVGDKDKRIEFLGNKSSEQVSKIMGQSKIFVQVSDYEGMSFSLLEAMAGGLVPIVSTAIGNIAVIKNNQNGRAITINVAQLALTIQEVLSNQSEFEALSEAAIKTVREHFNGRVLRQKILRILDGI